MVPSIPARLVYLALNSAVPSRSRAACSASYCSLGLMVRRRRGYLASDRVHSSRLVQGPQSLVENFNRMTSLARLSNANSFLWHRLYRAGMQAHSDPPRCSIYGCGDQYRTVPENSPSGSLGEAKQIGRRYVVGVPRNPFGYEQTARVGYWGTCDNAPVARVWEHKLTTLLSRKGSA